MNKKGFSLAELLCATVVLALIFLIVTPIIKNIIRTSRLGALKESVNGYVRAVNNQVNLGGYNLDDYNSITVPNNKILESEINDIELSKINIGGLLPDYVKLTFNDAKTNVISGNFCMNDNSFDYDINTGVTVSSNNYCNFLAGGLYTIDNTLVASWDTLVNTYGLKYDINYTNNTSSETDYDKASTSGTKVLSNPDLSTGVKLVIPEGVTYLGENLFRNSTQLKVVSFPKSLVEIKNYAFRNDSFNGQIEKLIFPYNANLERIGRTTFMGNKKIKELFIPRSVEIIDGNAFRGGNLTTNAMGIEKISFGYDSNLNYIGDSAFASNPSLKSIYFPSRLSIIDDYAFQYCISIKSLRIPASVTKIGARAFEGYTPDSTYPSGYYMSIKEIIFEPNSKLEYIGEQAFFCNDALTTITIPASVTTIGPKAIGIGTLKRIVFENSTGWYHTSNQNATTGTSIDLSDSEANVELLTYYYIGQWLKRN